MLAHTFMVLHSVLKKSNFKLLICHHSLEFLFRITVRTGFSHPWQQEAVSGRKVKQWLRMSAGQHCLCFISRHSASTCFRALAHSPSIRRRAILLLEPFQEINSTLIPGTRQHFHYHSFLMSRGLVQFAIISKQDKYVNSL